jgi:ketosteroid isomerase-like protein
MPATARFFELILIPLTEKPRTRKELTDPLKVQEAISYLNRFCARFRWLVVGLLLVSLYKGAAPTTQAGENNDVKVLLRLEGEIAQAWVQRDRQTLEQILADDFTLAGTGDSLIGKSQYIAGLDNPEFRTTSAIIEDVRIRVYGDAAVVTGRATYQGWSKKRGKYVHRLRFTDTFIQRDSTWKCVATHASALAAE